MTLGRKATITLYGMTLVSVMSSYAMWRGVIVPDTALAALATMVVAFCGGNAAATYAHSGTSTHTTETSRQITERRNTGDGTEDTP